MIEITSVSLVVKITDATIWFYHCKHIFNLKQMCCPKFTCDINFKILQNSVLDVDSQPNRLLIKDKLRNIFEIELCHRNNFD